MEFHVAKLKFMIKISLSFDMLISPMFLMDFAEAKVDKEDTKNNGMRIFFFRSFFLKLQLIIVLLDG